VLAERVGGKQAAARDAAPDQILSRGERRREDARRSDLESDVAGAQRAGMAGILVRTGKFRAEELASSGVRPDWLLYSVADLPAALL